MRDARCESIENGVEVILLDLVVSAISAISIVAYKVVVKSTIVFGHSATRCAPAVLHAFFETPDFEIEDCKRNEKNRYPKNVLPEGSCVRIQRRLCLDVGLGLAVCD
jgi:hypothetical protein